MEAATRSQRKRRIPDDFRSKVYVSHGWVLPRNIARCSYYYRTAAAVESDGSLQLWPYYLGPRLQQLLRRMDETGLQRRFDALAANRRSLSRAWLEQSDAMGRAALVMVVGNMEGWRDLAVAWASMGALAVVVWLGEFAVFRV